MLSASLLLAAQARGPEPPIAPVIPHKTVLHGQTLTDNYAWLRNKQDPRTLNYLKAENAYTQAVMKPTKALQEKLYKEMVGRIQEDDSSVPIQDKGYWYYVREVQAKEYPIHCRRKGTMKGREEVLLDENQLAKGKRFFDLGSLDISPNGRFAAYLTDVTGFRMYEAFVKDLQTGRLLKDRIGQARQIAWGQDNKTLFFVTEDSSKRWNRVWRHELGSLKKPSLVFEEKDTAYDCSIGTTSDEKYLLVDSESKDANEVRFLDLSKPTSPLRIVEPRTDNLLYDLDHHAGRFYIRTNDVSPMFRLCVAPIGHPSKTNWKELIPPSEAVSLSGVQAFRDFLVMGARKDGFRTLLIRSFKDNRITELPGPTKVADMGLYANPDFNATALTYSFSTYNVPDSVFRYDLGTGKKTLLKQDKVRGGYRSDDYVIELVWATAKDGTRIPISLVRKKTTKPSAKTPLYLNAYGAYGASSDPWFSYSRLSLLDRGGIFAVAHVRGGGEFGRPWYEAGKMKHKINTFSDFIACGDFLVNQGYTSHAKLAINGGSAGGLLIGAVLNMRPDLARVAVADVPFVDVINTMLDESIPLTTSEFTEWGNPKVKEQFDWLMAYSPYDNVKAQKYPHTLVTTSLNDSQVLYHEPAKWCAKLRATKTDSNALLLKCNMDAGHGGASGRYSAYREVAFEYAFVMRYLGMK